MPMVQWEMKERKGKQGWGYVCEGGGSEGQELRVKDQKR